MPVVTDPDHHRVTLTGAGGHALLRMTLAGPNNGYDLEPTPDIPVGDLAATVAAELAGWQLAAPPELAEALRPHGARFGRHAHLHSRDLRANPPPAQWAVLPPPEGTTVVPVRGIDPDLADAMEAAYPPGHPDREAHESPTHALREILTGAALGPLLPCSRTLLAADGRACAGSLVTDRPGEPPWAGPWLTELHRHPERAPRGAGRFLLRRSMAAAAADGLAALSLVVTEGNPARRLYDDLGLRRITSTVNVALP